MIITFDADNAAFEDMHDECARILRAIAEKIDRGETGGDVRDINGNKVGTWSMSHN